MNANISALDMAGVGRVTELFFLRVSVTDLKIDVTRHECRLARAIFILWGVPKDMSSDLKIAFNGVNVS